jgi:hypothetical protein
VEVSIQKFDNQNGRDFAAMQQILMDVPKYEAFSGRSDGASSDLI